MRLQLHYFKQNRTSSDVFCFISVVFKGEKKFGSSSHSVSKKNKMACLNKHTSFQLIKIKSIAKRSMLMEDSLKASRSKRDGNHFF